jgi:pimeloyl-ACP methyl ester carboxylesterase
MTILYALAALVVLIPCFVAALSYTIFYYELANKPHPFFTAACPRRAWACLLSGVCSCLGSLLLIILTYPLGWFAHRHLRATPATGEPVVVCLHGIYHNPAAFLAIRPALMRAGFRHILVPGYGSLSGDFEAVTARLLAVLRREIPPQAPLILVGHSLGGLFARRLMAEPDMAGRVRAAVTLGSPHHGSKLTALSIGRLGRSFMPSGPLPALLARLPDPPGAALLALVSPVDNMVIPLSGLEIPRPAWRTETTRPVSHETMLYHPAVIARAVAFVREHGLTPTP